VLILINGQEKQLRSTGRQFGRKNRGSALSEFGPALFLFFLVFLFPLLNLVQFACGACTVFLIARQAAQAAAGSPDFSTGLQRARDTAAMIATNGFGQFAHLQAANQYGVSLYVDQTTVSNNQQTVYGPDTPVKGTIDPVNNIYEIEARCLYDVGPMLNLRNVPWIGDIPLIGKPARLNFSCQRAAEFPDGLLH